MKSDFDHAQGDSHPKWQPDFYWAQCDNDRKLHQRCHFDEYARRNLFGQTDLSYRRGDSKRKLSVIAQSLSADRQGMVFEIPSHKLYS